MSEMSYNDLITYGATLGFGENTLDNYRSVVWNGNATTASGNGFTNNRPLQPTANFSSSRYQTAMSSGGQNSLTVNDCISQKLGRYIDTSTTNNKLK